MGRPTFHQAVDLLAAYMSKVERQTYESRARLDSGVGDCEGYLDMTSTRLSTPSTSGTASKCSTRSRTVQRARQALISPPHPPQVQAPTTALPRGQVGRSTGPTTRSSTTPMGSRRTCQR